MRRFFPALAFLLIGCGAHPVEQTITQTYAVEPTASVSIANIDGSIFLYGGERPEVIVQANKKAYSRERLDKIDIVMSAEPNSVEIKTKFPPRPKWSLSDRSGKVDYVIVVPQTANIPQLELETGEVFVRDLHGGPVRARLGNGLFYVQNCFCDLDLAVRRGSLSVFFNWWEPRKFSVNAVMESAKTLFTFTGDAAFHLVADAITGSVHNDFAEQEERTRGGVHKIDKMIGENPNAEIRIQAREGNIRIAEENP